MSSQRFLMLLKTRGALTAADIAKEFNITNEGARLQLLKLAEHGLVVSEPITKGVGRPKQVYRLTESGNAQFPDTHAELTVQLIKTIRETLGEPALEAVIEARENNTNFKYNHEIKNADALEDRVNKLAEIRSREGYMATYEKSEEGFLLIENHCPICAAAQICQGFCNSELRTFKNILGENVEIKRIDHILAGARRCAYSIKEKSLQSLK